MKQLLILIILILNLDAYELKLTSEEIKQIYSSHNKSKIIKRLNNYEKFKEKVKDYNLFKKLSHVNSYLNNILPQYDIKTSSSLDYWATPKEFLILGLGDCEDYAIAKYFTLLSLGIKKEQLYLSVVNYDNRRDFHMVLLYFENKNEYPLVLDNLSFKVLPLNKREDLKPIIAFNEYDSYLLKKSKLNKKIKIPWSGEDKWKELLNRVYNLNE